MSNSCTPNSKLRISKRLQQQQQQHSPVVILSVIRVQCSLIAIMLSMMMFRGPMAVRALSLHCPPSSACAGRRRWLSSTVSHQQHRHMPRRAYIHTTAMPMLSQSSSSNSNSNSNNDITTAESSVPSITSIQNRLCTPPTPPHSTPPSPQSIHQTLLSSITLLTHHTTPEPTISACHLLSSALPTQFTWEDNGFAVLLNILDNPTSFDHPAALSKNRLITDEELNVFSRMVQRRIRHEPLQYIIGQWDFHLVTLRVRKPCLCPRPETEELVEFVAEEVRDIARTWRLTGGNGGDGEKEKKVVRVLDVGAGTGAIGIALAALFQKDDGVDLQVVAIDVTEEAVDLSTENALSVLGDAASIGTNANTGTGTGGVEGYKSLLCSAKEYTNHASSTTTPKDPKNQQQDDNLHIFDFDIIVSNPPYIPSKDMDTLSKDVVSFEDHGALCGGHDGMDVIRDIVARLPEWCRVAGGGDIDDGIGGNKEDGRSFPVCWMEVDPSQPKLIKQWLSNQENSLHSDGGAGRKVTFVDTYTDFNGLDRFVKLQID